MLEGMKDSADDDRDDNDNDDNGDNNDDDGNQRDYIVATWWLGLWRGNASLV